MSEVYEAILRHRRDMTDWLIHFTKDVDSLPAREVLLRILVEGALRPGFAPKGNPPRSTIYSLVPAVCFTEQPLLAFRQYLQARSNASSMAGYGILIHKHDVYIAGGLPVIYGLGCAEELPATHPDYQPSRRLLDPKIISYKEQYRYVTFVPTRTPYPIDWSHEREWRWPQGKTPFIKDVFALGKVWSSSDGTYKARVHTFVRNDIDIPWIQEKICKAVIERTIGKIGLPDSEDYAQTWKHILPRVGLLSLETVQRELDQGRDNYARVEDLPNGAILSLV